MSDTLTPELAKLQSDLETHHIEGIAREGNTPFACPLITHVEGNLWQGGCRNGVSLQGQFKHIISLYPWERYDGGPGGLDSFVEVKLYDGPTVPDEGQLYALAGWINNCKFHGRTLVHCQAGLNRSGLLTGLSLVMDEDSRFYGKPAEAIAHMRAKRSPAVLCNKKFEKWLLDQGR